MVKDHLESVGYTVDGANSGDEALKLVAGRSYDVVIVDVIMPGMSGFDLVEARHQVRRAARLLARDMASVSPG